MKRKIILLIGAVLMIAALMSLASCSDYPYEDLADDGYNICVRYDANGGYFVSNGKQDMTVVDIYHSSLESITLFAPNSSKRGSQEMQNYSVSLDKLKLLGWYVVPTNENGEILDADGNPCKTSGKEPAYGEKIDFGEDYQSGAVFKLNKDRTYTRDNPLTLCARWGNYTTVEFYIKDSSGTWVQFTKLVDGESTPLSYSTSTIKLPCIDVAENDLRKEGYGNWKFYSDGFDPTKSPEFPRGYSFSGAYLDPDLTNKISQTMPTDEYIFNVEKYLDDNPDVNPDEPIKIYTDWEEGNWFNIYETKQLSKVFISILRGIIPTDVKIRLMNDIDFTKKPNDDESGWLLNMLQNVPDSYDFYIDGNGYSLKNIDTTVSADSSFGGIFKKLSDKAVIKNLTIKDSTFTVPKYLGKDNAHYGIFAGEITDGATIENVKLDGCTIKIDKDIVEKIIQNNIEIYVGAPKVTESGTEAYSGIAYSNITVLAPEDVKFTILTDGYIKFEKINNQE